MKFLVTGGAGFIGSCFIRYILKNTNHEVLNIDKLSYASNLMSLESVSDNNKYEFIKSDICNYDNIKEILLDYCPDYIIHFAAESHVDRSIDGPSVFLQTNVVGTFNLLEASRLYFSDLSSLNRDIFRFLHVSTDEVYGSLGKNGAFSERSPYDPSSPYSATKASSDHLVRSWGRTFNLPILITNCSNNYGPFQSLDKLIPLVIYNAMHEKEIPIYGDGSQIRDWLYVDDHVSALYEIISNAEVSETYNIGGNNQKTNLEVVNTICEMLDNITPRKSGKSYNELIRYVADRPGHDIRYAIDSSKLKSELNWEPAISFEDGINKTIRWYLKSFNKL